MTQQAPAPPAPPPPPAPPTSGAPTDRDDRAFRKLKPGKGRPNRVPTAEQTEKMCSALRAGNYLEPSAIVAGIPKSTLYQMLKKGRAQKRGPYRDFLDAVERAMAEAEVRDVALLAQHGKTNPRALEWRLERRFGRRWGRRATLALTGEPDETEDGTLRGGPVDVRHALREQAEATLRALEAQGVNVRDLERQISADIERRAPSPPDDDAAQET